MTIKTVNSETEEKDTEKLVEKGVPLSLEVKSYVRLSTKKRGKIPAHIRPHVVKGRIYYTYCQGAEPEIYLGTARAILEAVRRASGQ